MTNVHIPDDILDNILARLPGKTLLRLRCVSTRWNRLISDPCFMRSRSRRMFLHKHPQPFVVVDENVPICDKVHSIVKICSPLENHVKVVQVIIVGTFNGIVLLVFKDISLRTHMILFNPLTRASKKLLVMDPPSKVQESQRYAFGFFYGTTTNNLKIVRIGVFFPPDRNLQDTCDVFDIKTSTWKRSPIYLNKTFFFWTFAGKFLNGFLYWVISFLNMEILALDVEEMVFSIIKLPHGLDFREMIELKISDYGGTILGSLDGSLCMIYKSDASTTRFDVWVMKEQGAENPWLKVCSFTFGLEGNSLYEFHPMCILDDGKILLTNGSNQLVIYDISKDSCKTLNNLATRDSFNDVSSLKYTRSIRSLVYVESLISPSDICFN